jgi:CheY-like chemotaxis protein
VRVLVVDDNSVNRTVAARLAERAGCAVDMATNGVEAVAAVRQSRYDLVLMDCQMPEMDGYEATREIRETERTGTPRTTIIAMTANATTGDRERCLAAGMDDYLCKPVTAVSMREMLSTWRPAAPSQPPANDHEPPVDAHEVAELRTLADSDEGFGRIVTAFATHASRWLEEMSAARVTGDAPAFTRAAVDLRDAALEVGAHPLYRHCNELANEARAGHLGEITDKQMHYARAEYERVRDALVAVLRPESLASRGN